MTLDRLMRSLDDITTRSGTPYVDIRTVKGDLARLVVGILAHATSEELVEAYHGAGWKGQPNVRAIAEAARRAWQESGR